MTNKYQQFGVCSPVLQVLDVVLVSCETLLMCSYRLFLLILRTIWIECATTQTEKAQTVQMFLGTHVKYGGKRYGLVPLL